MVWLSDLVPSPNNRSPLTAIVFFADFLPVMLFYYFTAVMVLIPKTFHLRLAFLPITLWSAFRAATSIDIALAFHQPSLAYLNYGLCIVMVTTCMRAIEWTFRMQPLARVHPLYPNSNVSRLKMTSETSSDDPGDLKKALWNAFDLSFNLRGIGWNWPYIGLQIPPETRPTETAPAFAWAVLTSAIKHALLLDVLQYIIQSLSPSTFGSPAGGTIFVSSLPPFYRYTYSSFVSLLSGLVIYCAIQVGYDFCTLIGIILFRQYPSQWPPIFNEPWRSTSLSEFWAQRWHQLFRHCFITIGGRPFAWLIGRSGVVMGVFLTSGLLHDLGMWGMGRGMEFWSVSGFFLMMGIGVLVEGMWKSISGEKTRGWVGWTWTMFWVIGWSHILADAWFRRGLAGSTFIPESSRPSKIFVYHMLRIHSTFS